MNMNDLKKPYVYIIYLAIALTVFGLIVTFTQIKNIPVFRLCIIIVGYLLVLYYTFIGYRIPHGNLLRYLILGFGFLLILTSSSFVFAPQSEPVEAIANTADDLRASSAKMMVDSLTLGLSILLSGYVAGRLNKFEQNKYLFTLVLILLIIRVFFSSNNQMVMLGDFNEVILWFDISCAYFARYNQH